MIFNSSKKWIVKKIMPMVFLGAIFFGVFAPVSVGIISGPTISVQQANAVGEVDNLDQEVSSKSCVGWTGINLGGCIATLLYYIPYALGGFLMSWAGKFLDITAAFTLSSNFYDKTQFIKDGWSITRDFSNIFFIFILLYIALTLMLGLGGGHHGPNPKKMFMSLIIIAVFINFSFFVTEVVIDASNSLALVFYNRVSTKVAGSDVDSTYELQQGSKDVLGGIQPKRLSNVLIDSFKPQIITNDNFLKAFKTEPDKSVPSLTLIVLLLVCGILFLVVAWSFFITGLSFIGRLAMLAISIVFAPFAFITFIIPSAHQWEGFGWSSWWKKLIEVAFAAPIYFFMLLLISFLAKSQWIKPGDISGLEGEGATIMLLTMVIVATVLITLLLQATKYARKAGGQLGEMAIKLATGGAALAGGLAIGVASGGLAVAGRKSLGAIGSKALDNQDLKDRAMNGDQLAKFQLKTAQWASKSSFDARRTKAMGELSSATGVNVNPKLLGLSGLAGISLEKTAGGIKEEAARKADKEFKMKDLLGSNTKAKEALDKLKEDKEKEVEDLEGRLRVARAEAKQRPSQTNKNLVTKLEKDIDEKKRGERIIYQQGDVGITTTPDGNLVTQADVDNKVGYKAKYTAADVANGTLKADGSAVTQNDVNKGVVRAEALGIKDLENASKNIEKTRFTEYLKNVAEKSGHAVTIDPTKDYDALGNLKNFKVDVKTVVRTNLRRAVLEGFGKAGVGMAIGTAIAPGIGTAIGGLAGIVTQYSREAINKMLGGEIGSRKSFAEAVKKLQKDDYKPHEHHEIKISGFGLVDAIKSAIKGSIAGAGGGHSKPTAGKAPAHP